MLKLGAPAKTAANWIIGPTVAYLKEAKLEITETAITPENIADIVEAVNTGVLSSTTAKLVLAECLKGSQGVRDVIQAKGLAQLSDEADLKKVVLRVIEDSPEQVSSYRSGKTKVRQYFFGEVMKSTQGKANPQIINKLLDELLA